LVKISKHPHHVHPHPEMESQNLDQSVVSTRKKRELTRECVNFEQKNDYESEKIVKIMSEAKKVDTTTLGSVEI
jgi:hypothetical protein